MTRRRNLVPAATLTAQTREAEMHITTLNPVTGRPVVVHIPIDTQKKR